MNLPRRLVEIDDQHDIETLATAGDVAGCGMNGVHARILFAPLPRRNYPIPMHYDPSGSLFRRLLYGGALWLVIGAGWVVWRFVAWFSAFF